MRRFVVAALGASSAVAIVVLAGALASGAAGAVRGSGNAVRGSTVQLLTAAGARTRTGLVGSHAPVRARRLRTVNMRSLERRQTVATRQQITPAERQFLAREQASAGALAAPRAGQQPPNVPGLPVEAGGTRGFEGLSHRDQAFASGDELEPPDQGLCGGRFGATTFVFESVNLALALYDTDGNQYTPAIDLSDFFGVAPAFDPDTNQFGPFLSDPKCYFDPDTGHWFHTVVEIDVNPTTGDLANHAATLVAVSASRDPLGDYNIYSIDATDATHPHCPCFGDQPLIGADANGFYVSTSEYSLHPFGAFSNGSQIYAFDKRALESGASTVGVHIATGTTRTASVQPATSPAGHYETARGGTEYFMSGFDCLPPDCHVNPGFGNRITVWALTHTSTLRTSSPALTLSATTITSELYGQPIGQQQRPGPRPLGASLGEPLPRVEANDTRMNQVVYAAGRLWSGLNTIIAPGPRDGIAWFEVRPSVALPTVRASIVRQGYIGARNAFVSFPSVGVNDAGRGVVAYTLMGPGYFPSAAWTNIDTTGTTGPVRVARFGFRPEDGFTCYPEFYPPGTPLPVLCRWGDYSASVALPNGQIWSGTEFIGDDARTTFANWGTFLWPVRR